MLADLSLSDPTRFILAAIHSGADGIIFSISCIAPQAACPLCGQPSQQVRGRYVRHLRDLPWANRSAQIHLSVRKYRCRQPDCPQQIFTERLPSLVRPFARTTIRMEDAMRQLGLTAGGEGGARLGCSIGLPGGPDTFLRLIRSTALPPPPAVHAAGIDEWAWRKQRQYGIIIVDLETHHVVDLLPDESRATVTAWLQQHPEIDVISRDRSGPFAAAARDGAPQAEQVADRFHLMQDLSEVLQHVFERHSRVLEPARGRVEDASAPSPSEASMVSSARAGQGSATLSDDASAKSKVGADGAAAARAERRSQREERFAEAQRLAELGLSKRAIAEQLGVDPKTIRHWLRSDAYNNHPGAKGCGRPIGNQLDGYKPYLLERYQQGCHNSSLLYRELVGRGYKGSSSVVRKWVTMLRQADDPAQAAAAQSARRYSIRDLVFSVMRRPEERTAEQVRTVARLTELGGVIEQACELTQGFADLVRQRQEGGLSDWMAKAEASELDEFKTFLNGLRRDETAVRAGLSLPWSNGPTEGNNHRFKLLKRSMYGRANFDLLRKRVLLAA